MESIYRLRPLTRRNLEAVLRLYEENTTWQQLDAALAGVAQKFPGFDMQSCLIKVGLLDRFFSTNVYSVPKMAKHISKILTRRPAPAGIALVEEISQFAHARGRIRRQVSFAAKFCHLFVDPDIPLYDSRAVSALAQLAKKQSVPMATPYSTFHSTFFSVRNGLTFDISVRELDHFLWIAGSYVLWRNNGKAPIASELRALFGKSRLELDKLVRKSKTPPKE
jgi:hypothetical protein